MVDNDNVVRIETKNESAKRLILNEIQAKLGFCMSFEGENLQLQGSISNAIISNIINKIITESMWNMVSMGPAIDHGLTTEKIKKKRVKTKDMILSMFQLKKELKNAEILEELDITEVGLSKNLRNLAQDGKIEKVKRGCWRIIETEEMYKKSTTEDIEI